MTRMHDILGVKPGVVFILYGNLSCSDKEFFVNEEGVVMEHSISTETLFADGNPYARYNFNVVGPAEAADICEIINHPELVTITNDKIEKVRDGK